MNNMPSSVLETQQTHAPWQDILNYQTVGMYEQQSREHYVPTALASSPVSKSIAPLDPDLYEQKQPVEAFQWTAEPLRTLQGTYAFLSDSRLIADVLQHVPALYPLLKAAVEPLGAVFGKNKLLQLEALASDDDTVLRVIVKLPHDVERPATLMRKFKLDWWFKNCSRSGASLIFDYEIGNGF